MKTLKRAILFLFLAALLTQLILPVFFVSRNQSGFVAPDRAEHQVVITADVCSKKLSGTVTGTLIPLHPVITIIIILTLSFFIVKRDKIFLPITSNNPFHPPRAR